MKKILITGFDPFGGEAMNPAYEAVKLIADSIKVIQACMGGKHHFRMKEH